MNVCVILLTKSQSSTPSSNESDMYAIGPIWALKAWVSYMKKWLKCPWSSLLLHCLLSLGSQVWFYVNLLYWSVINFPITDRRKNSGLFLHACRHHLRVDSCNTIISSCDIPEGQWQIEILPVYKTLNTWFMRKKSMIFVSHVNVHKKVASVEEELNN
jgi:hypothetical protein